MEERHIWADVFADETPWKVLKRGKENNWYDKTGAYKCRGFEMRFTPNEKFFEALAKKLRRSLKTRTDVCYKHTKGGIGKDVIILAVNNSELGVAVGILGNLEDEVLKALRAEKLAACYAAG